jgi:hypothetical protein
VKEELEKLKALFGVERFQSGQFSLAKQLLDDLVTRNYFAGFLTLKAYPLLKDD